MAYDTVIDYYVSSRLLYASVTPVMGTRLEFLFAGKDEEQAREIGEDIIGEVCRLEKLMSRHDPGSELFGVNHRAIHSPVVVSVELWDILQSCRRFHTLTSGLFDITLNDLKKVVFHETEKSIFFAEPGISLDLGGYGKGYALSRIEKILQDNKIETALVNFGNSSVLAIGSHVHGDHWPIGITHPVTGETIGHIRLKDNSMSTSGNTPSHPQHILNPHTGTYYKGNEIITILSPDPVEAEVLSTSLLLADRSQREQILSRFDVDDFRVFEI